MIRKITVVIIVTLFLFSLPLIIVKGQDNGIPDPEENSPITQEPKWSFNTNSDEAYPYLAPDGRLYVFDSEENKLISLDKNGLPDWEYVFNDDFTGISEFNDGYIYLITQNDSINSDILLKIDSEDGSKVWKDTLNIENVNNLLVNDRGRSFFHLIWTV